MAVGAPTQVGTNTAATSSQSSIAATGCVIPAGSLVVVVVGFSNATTAAGPVSGVSDGSNAYAKAVAETNVNNDAYDEQWYYYDAAGGTKTVTASFTAVVNMAWIYVYAISDAAPTSTLDTTGVAKGSATAATITTSGNVAQADSVAIASYFIDTSTAWGADWPPMNYTSLAAVVNATRTRGFVVASHEPLTAGSTESAVVTSPATSDRAGTLAVYKGAASAPAFVPLILQYG